MLLKTQLIRVRSRFDEIINAKTKAFSSELDRQTVDDIVKRYFGEHKVELADLILASSNITDRYSMITAIQSHPVVMAAQEAVLLTEKENKRRVCEFQEALRAKADELLDELYLGETDAIGKITEFKAFKPAKHFHNVN